MQPKAQNFVMCWQQQAAESGSASPQACSTAQACCRGMHICIAVSRCCKKHTITSNSAAHSKVAVRQAKRSPLMLSYQLCFRFRRPAAWSHTQQECQHDDVLYQATAVHESSQINTRFCRGWMAA